MPGGPAGWGQAAAWLTVQQDPLGGEGEGGYGVGGRVGVGDVDKTAAAEWESPGAS